MEIKIKKILPADVFVSANNPELADVELWKGASINRWGNRVCGNEFIDIFANLIRRYKIRSMPFYAKKMGMQAYELSTIIKVSSGISSASWAIEYLTLEACDLLENTNKSIEEVGRILNFTPSAFCQFFVRNKKCSPTEWRMLK